MRYAYALLVLQFLGISQISTAINWTQNSPLTNATIVKSCEAFQCQRSAAYELALEQEYWRHVQADDVDGMKTWLTKMKAYTESSPHKNQDLKHKGRLWMLGAGGHTMVFSNYDIHSLVPIYQSLKEKRILSGVAALFSGLPELPALYHLEESLRLSIKANRYIPNHLNAQTFFAGIMAFAQFATSDLTGLQPALDTVYGPSCKSLPPLMQRLIGHTCFDKGAMGPAVDSYLTCIDQESCQEVGTGTEGIVASLLAMGMLHDHALVQQALTTLGDEPEGEGLAHCNDFWCHTASPNDPLAEVPEATTIAPFKKVSMLLAIAQMYAKLGDFSKSEQSFHKAEEEAERISWPFTETIPDIKKALFEGQDGNPSLVQQWQEADPTKDHLGAVQFPLPPFGKGCKGCHFAGVLPDHVDYTTD